MKDAIQANKETIDHILSVIKKEIDYSIEKGNFECEIDKFEFNEMEKLGINDVLKEKGYIVKKYREYLSATSLTYYKECLSISWR